MEIIKLIKISQIDESPFQGRILNVDLENIENNSVHIQELVKSIKNNGLLQPISVRQVDEKFELIDGHRRLHAYKLLGKEEIKAIISDFSDKKAQSMSLVANLQRENLSNIERALAFRKVLDTGVFKNQKELSQKIGKDVTFVGDTLNILNMDQRIISDLMQNNSISDVRMLRLIRKAGKIDEDNLSTPQHLLYQKVKNDKIDRSAVQKILQSNMEEPNKAIEISGTPKKIIIKFNQKLDKWERKKFDEILEKKISEAYIEAKGLKSGNE